MRNPHMEIIRWQYLRMSTAATLGTQRNGWMTQSGEPLCILLVSAALPANTFGLPHSWWLFYCAWQFAARYSSTRVLQRRRPLPGGPRPVSPSSHLSMSPMNFER
jgi:hypothetical protein